MEQWTLPPDWQQAGARFGRDGLLYLGEWRRGFTVHELRALFFRCQQVGALERDVKRLNAELAAKDCKLDEAEGREAWYRGQLVLESRWGMMLERLAC